MEREKIPWVYIAIGWVAGVCAARLCQGFATNNEQFLAITALIALPFAINWLNQMAAIFKHH